MNRPLRIVTYNMWHGLNGKGVLRFGELESRERRLNRYEVQKKELFETEADLFCLQEVNPLLSRSEELSKLLNCEEHHQVDQGGVDLFGFGFPVNLKTGLLTLAKPEFQLYQKHAIKLSGGIGFNFDRLGLQFSEFRYALMSRIHWGSKPILIVNLHLHHGPAWSATAEARLQELVLNGEITKIESRILQKQMEQAGERRRAEFEIVLKEVRRRRRKNEGVIIAGDFNADIREFGLSSDSEFIESFETANEGKKAMTWDPEHNKENHQLTQYLEPPVDFMGKPALLEVLRTFDAEARALDHILISKDLRPYLLEAKKVFHLPRQGLIGSDHFGIMVTLGRPAAS